MRSCFEDIGIAVVGATGIVGLEMLRILCDEHVARKNIYAIASSKSAGAHLRYGDGVVEVLALENFDFSKCQIALFSPGSAISEVYAPKAAEAGCVVIDNTSFFRMHDDVPLIVPEINMSDARDATRGIIANPNCSTIQLVMVLKPIIDLLASSAKTVGEGGDVGGAPIQHVFVATYQSISGAGKQAVDTLRLEQATDAQDWQAEVQTRHAEVLTRQAADAHSQQAADAQAEQHTKTCTSSHIQCFNKNLIPRIDSFITDGETKEEKKMFEETRKILHSNITVSATCVRVPVEIGHSEVVFFSTNRDVPLADIYDALRAFPGVHVELPEAHTYQTPREIAGTNEVFVSRLRKNRNGWYQMWVVYDNIRKGAALNAIQIAKEIVVNYSWLIKNKGTMEKQC
jgi:aspartate-semialdehyde dehydrogenase